MQSQDEGFDTVVQGHSKAVGTGPEKRDGGERMFLGSSQDWDLERETKLKKLVKPKFPTDFPGAVIQEGADELTLRADEEEVVRSFIDATNVGNQRWEPPLVDEDFHAICQATYKGVEEPEWEAT